MTLSFHHFHFAMKFLLNVFLLVGIIVGVLYFFFRDTPFVAAVLPQQIGNVAPHESVQKAFLRRVKIALDERESTDPGLMLDYYKEAVRNKFSSLAGGGTGIARDNYMRAKEQEFTAYVRVLYDANNSGALEKDEWPAALRAEMSVLDADKDEKLTYEEFWAKGRKQSFDAFTKADRNGDAVLSQEEYYNGLGGNEGARAAATIVDNNRNGAVNLDEIRLARYNAERHWQP